MSFDNLTIHDIYTVTTEKVGADRPLTLMYRGAAADGKHWFTGVRDTTACEWFLHPDDVLSIDLLEAYRR